MESYCDSFLKRSNTCILNRFLYHLNSIYLCKLTLMKHSVSLSDVKQFPRHFISSFNSYQVQKSPNWLGFIYIKCDF